MNGVIVIATIITLVFGVCFLFSHWSRREQLDLLQYTILLILYGKGKSTEFSILLYLRLILTEADSDLLQIFTKKDISLILQKRVKRGLMDQDDSIKPFLLYDLTESGEIWVEHCIEPLDALFLLSQKHPQ